MREFARRGAEPVVVGNPAKPRTSWWTVAESGASFRCALVEAQARMACDPHPRMPDVSHLREMRSALVGMHQIWQHREAVPVPMLEQYDTWVGQFANCWQALTWKPTVWVHWVAVHSAAHLRMHGNLHIFSSIPTERRHQGFKRDLRHAFQGWKITRPRSCCPAPCC